MIREIVTELACDIEGGQTNYATITSHGVVGIWDVNTRGRIKSLKTNYDFGGSRFLYFGRSDVVITASYTQSSISAYDLASGELIWIKAGVNADRLIPDFQGGVYINSSGVLQIGVKSGKYSSFEDGGKALACAPGGLLLTRREGQYVLFRKAELIKTFPAHSFDTLASAFGGDYIVVSESGLGSRIISRKTLECVAEVPGVVFHSVRYSTKSDDFCGVAVMPEKGAVLLRLGLAGHCICVQQLSSSIADFSLNGEFLITAKHEIISL